MTATLQRHNGQIFIPREHGATAMLLTPFFAAAILLRHVYWQEAVALLAIVITFAVKDPLIVLARQRWVWKQEHPETRAARQSATFELALLAVCGIALALTRDWRAFAVLFLAAAAFTALAVHRTVHNRQRSVAFQLLSAAALTSSSIAAVLSGAGYIPNWCWLLWGLSTLQATAGIFVVHARLDARVTARKGESAASKNRTAAFLLQILLLFGAVLFIVVWDQPWIAAALVITAACYLFELRRQRNPASLQMPLKRVGQQALAVSTFFAVMLITGLW